MNKNDNTDNRQNQTNINWFPGHMAKTRKELKEKLSLIDIVYEVIDARMPISSKIADIDDLVKNKLKILIVSKYDLCDKQKTDIILNIYEKKGYIVIPVELLNTNKLSIVIKKTTELLEDINNARIKKGLKPRIARALVLGVPNVGKSTLINRLVGKNAVKTGNIPGITKSISWIRVNKDIELMDTPGILWPKIEVEEHGYNLAALSSIKEEILNTEDLCNYIIDKMLELYPDNFYERYDTTTNNKEEIYATIAKKRGLLSKGGEPDYEKVYLTVIRDLKDGYLGKITFDR
jgi:ribosome biogenesis GTP-binding protein YlqF